MTNLEKTKAIFALVVNGAAAVVALSELWEKVGPEIKRIAGPVFEACKKVSKINFKEDIKEIKLIKNK